MSKKSRWTKPEVIDGIATLKLHSWKYFYDFVRQEMLDYAHYVWRGDRRDDRPLLPSFDRIYKGKERVYIEKRMRQHLTAFKLAARGRRGLNPPKIDDDNDWWALGQHNGLDTPLLDWTRSPFVALFFAFEKVCPQQTACRAVYAINPSVCEVKSKDLYGPLSRSDRPDVVEFFSPLQDENARLVNQNGLFSRCTAGKSLDAWVKEHFSGQSKGGVLIKVLIPDSDRDECLRTLNKMNINHLTLYPDLYGASHFTNMLESIEHY